MKLSNVQQKLYDKILQVRIEAENRPLPTAIDGLTDFEINSNRGVLWSGEWVHNEYIKGVKYASYQALVKSGLVFAYTKEDCPAVYVARSHPCNAT